jgi:hypothetical protein
LIDVFNPYRSKKITQHAKGQYCTLQLDGVCNSDTSTTVFAHAPSLFRGISQKGNDYWGFFACSACHDIVDKRVYDNLEDEYIISKCYQAIEKTIYILFQDKILKDR